MLDWMETWTGGRFSLREPRPEDVDILDIAHALGHVTRYTGHVSAHYSVAEHSILVSQLVPDEELDDAVQALARRIADGPTLALAQTKSLLTRELDMSLSASVELDAMTQALLMTTDDHAEFHAAFNAGRKPMWRGQ